ncbi:MAG: hypothetical protein ACOC3G_08195 [Phycisphaeraceae bacterium]
MNARIRSDTFLFTFLLTFLLILPAFSPVRGQSQIGGAGHYLQSFTDVSLLNPDGKAFEIRLHRFDWWEGVRWDQERLPVRLTDAEGNVIFDKRVDVPDDRAVTLPIEAGHEGAHGLTYWSLSTDLEHAVADAKHHPGRDAKKLGAFYSNPFVARRWWFYVPEGTERFTVRSQSGPGRTQREDGRFVVFSPRGQRMAARFGVADPIWQDGEIKHGQDTPRYQRADVLVEPGSAGRFWAIEVGFGDSHNYNDVNISLEGVPPYLAMSPEAWFNPETGEPAKPKLYDDSSFVFWDEAPPSVGLEQYPWAKRWSPVPSLGDEDGVELRTPAEIALWNPDNRELRLAVATYIPRAGDQARVRWNDAEGKELLNERFEIHGVHGDKGWNKTLNPGPGVSRLHVEEAEQFWMYTYPATPIVLVGEAVDDDWQRVRLDVGQVRNWYFRVPEGTKQFHIRAASDDENRVMKLAVNAPDRTMKMIYDDKGEVKVDVPDHLAGRIWHLRIGLASATRLRSEGEPAALPMMRLDVDFKGVPALLAPSWEQWFDPTNPKPPHQRGTGQ